MSWKRDIAKNVRELRFVFCHTSAHSANVRNYIQNNYVDIKSANPELPFIVRDCKNAQPKVMARYDFGVDKRIYVPNLIQQDVDEVVRELVEQTKEVNAAVPHF